MSDYENELPRYIVVEGPIGVGKTTLVSLFAERFGANTVLEIFEENPFLAKFYGDQEAYAFQTEMFFLLSRYKQQEQFAQRDMFSTLSVSDYLFVKCRLFASLTLSDHELTLYDRMYNILKEQVPEPDVVIHLHAPLDVLQERINKRGRPYEQDMDAAYLDRLRSLYHNFFAHYEEAPLVEVDTSEVNFTKEPDAIDELMERVKRAHQASVTPPQAIEF